MLKIFKSFDRTFFKFIIVGVINTIVGTSTMFLLYNLAHTSYYFSSAMNYIVGSICSYFLNKYFTFQKKGFSLKELIFFALNIFICYIIAYWLAKNIIYYLFEKFLQEYIENIALKDNVAMFCGMCTFVLLNYFSQRYIVFKKVEK